MVKLVLLKKKLNYYYVDLKILLEILLGYTNLSSIYSIKIMILSNKIL